MLSESLFSQSTKSSRIFNKKDFNEIELSLNKALKQNLGWHFLKFI